MGSSKNPRREGGKPQNPAAQIDASLRVLRVHLRKTDMTVEKARDAIAHVAARVEAGMAGGAIDSLVGQLEKETGCTIAELAALADQWPIKPARPPE